MTAIECSTDAGVIIATGPGKEREQQWRGDIWIALSLLLMLFFVVVDMCEEGFRKEEGHGKIQKPPHAAAAASPLLPGAWGSLFSSCLEMCRQD